MKSETPKSYFINDKVMTVCFLGEVRVGRITYRQGRQVYPSYPNFTPIVVLTKSSEYGDLGPYVLKNEKGELMENIWQASKVYEWIPDVCEYYSRWDNTIIWKHSKERHISEESMNDSSQCPNKKYWTWRSKLLACPYAVRYPVGMTHRHSCLYAIESRNGPHLDYVEARKGIYFRVYRDLVKKQKKFKELRRRLEKGENLLIIEVDGPHQESLDYYREKYSVKDTFIDRSTVYVSPENMKIMLNDTKHPFGHGYCLAIALLEQDSDVWDEMKK